MSHLPLVSAGFVDFAGFASFEALAGTTCRLGSGIVPGLTCVQSCGRNAQCCSTKSSRTSSFCRLIIRAVGRGAAASMVGLLDATTPAKDPGFCRPLSGEVQEQSGHATDLGRDLLSQRSYKHQQSSQHLLKALENLYRKPESCQCLTPGSSRTLSRSSCPL